MRATFFDKKSFYSPCSNFVATLSLSTRILSQTLKNIICKVFLALLNPFNYFCVVLVTNVHRNRHISFRAFSKFIPHWNLDNSNRKDNEQETSTSMIFISPQREYHIIWRGLCLLYNRGSPEPKRDNKLKFPHLIFYSLSSGN